jgi:ribosomal protein S3
MGQKINPISLRLQNTNRYFDFCWYNDFYYSDLISQDLKIQRYLNSIFKQLQYPTGRFFIQSSQKKIKIFAFFCSPIKSRRIRSNYFKTKYYKITKNVLTLKKNKISNFLRKEGNNALHQGVYPFHFVKSVYPGAVAGICESKQGLVNVVYRKSAYLKYLLYRKYLQSFYGGKDKRLMFGNWFSFFRKKNVLASKLDNCSEEAALLPCQTLFDIDHIEKLFGQLSINRKTTSIEFPNNLDSLKFFNNGLVLERSSSNQALTFFQKVTDLLQAEIANKKLKKSIILTTSVLDKNQKLGLFNLPAKLETAFNANYQQNKKEVVERKRGMEYINKVDRMDTYFPRKGNTYSQFSFFFDQNLFLNSLKKSERFKQVLSEKNLNFYQYINKLTYRKHIERVLTQELSMNVNLHSVKTYDHFRSALFLAEEIVYYLERRIPFRRIKNRILKEVKFLPAIKGIRIVCSGRVGGRSKKAQRAKTENIKYGQTSLHVFSSRIDFASKNALTAFGLVGIKVWICYRD